MTNDAKRTISDYPKNLRWFAKSWDWYVSRKDGTDTLEERMSILHMLEGAADEIDRLRAALDGFVRAEELDLGRERRGTLERNRHFPVDRDGNQLWRFVGDALLLSQVQEGRRE